MVWFLAITLALFVFPGVVGAVAVAQTQSGTASGGASLAMLQWMDIRDSYGVRLTDYVFATSHGSVLNPLETIVSLILGLEFVGYLVIVTSAVWLIGFAISFQWLDPFGRALTGVADNLTGQIATPLLLTVAAGIGAFFVAWFVVRGFVAKATIQVVTMLGVAVLGPIVLAEPLADVLSSHGLLAQGRNVGIAVAAGLNGSTSPNPDQLVVTMQQDLADNFARHPLQVWNFGHVVDQSPRCAAVWSAGVQSGDDSRVLNGMRACGDTAAYAVAHDPSLDQVGSGLVLLVCGGIHLVFGASLGGKIIRKALDSIFHGFKAIGGFAAGGYIYGPLQTALVRDVVDSFVAAGAMAAYTVFLGVYVLFLGNLFRQAGGQVGVVLVLGAIVEIVAILQLRQLGKGLSKGNDWIANRFALAIQGAGSSGGGGGGTALGMGDAGAGHSLPGTALAGLAAINTIGANPITALLFRRRNPWDLDSKLRHQVDLMNLEANKEILGKGWSLNSARVREGYIEAARTAAQEYGFTHRGAAAAVDRVINRGGALGDVVTSMMDAGWKDKDMMVGAMRAYNYREQFGPSVWDGDAYIGEAAASMSILKLGQTPTNMALFQHTAHRLANRRYIDRVDRSALTKAEQDYLDDYFKKPTRDKIRGIEALASGSQITRDRHGNVVQSNKDYPLPLQFEGWSQERGLLMNRFIMPHLSQQYLHAAEAGDLHTASEILQTMAHSEYWTGNVKLTPSKALPRF
ncbi:hypothetical protein OH799_16180 [Nocardia sp. NBC_00881]|uniref:hypothetical protein n=1 Tax=Nocardia sp. NBC_00881 TaxID=2975995 RepID=UPI0038704ED1|nr:hypothetical protein OH799_16180 [Nocardia sp. NBC_00881]